MKRQPPPNPMTGARVLFRTYVIPAHLELKNQFPLRRSRQEMTLRKKLSAKAHRSTSGASVETMSRLSDAVLTEQNIMEYTANSVKMVVSIRVKDAKKRQAKILLLREREEAGCKGRGTGLSSPALSPPRNLALRPKDARRRRTVPLPVESNPVRLTKERMDYL